MDKCTIYMPGIQKETLTKSSQWVHPTMSGSKCETIAAHWIASRHQENQERASYDAAAFLRWESLWTGRRKKI